MELRLFYKYLFSYLSVLVIPLLLSLFLVGYFTQVLSEQTISKNNEYITQFKNSMEMQFNELEKIVVTLGNSNCTRPSFIKDSQFNAMQLIRLLGDYDISNDFIHEIVFYIHDDDYLYSSVSSYSLPSFPEHIYKFSNWGKNDFYDTLNHLQAPIVRPADNVVMSRVNNSRVITMLHPFPANYSKPYATVMFIIQESTIKGLIDKTLESYGGSIIISDNESGIITSLSDNEYLRDIDFRGLAQTLQHSSLKTVSIGDADYFVSHVQSGTTGRNYISVVPINAIMGSVNTIRSTIIWGIVILMLIGGVVIYFLTRISYSPILQLKNLARKSCADLPEVNNEIDTVRLAISDLANTKSALSEQIRLKNTDLNELLFLGLIKGGFNNIGEFNKKAGSIGIPQLKGPYYRVIDVLPYKYGNAVSIKENVIKAFSGDMLAGCNSFIADNISNHIVFIISTNDNDTQIFKVILQNIQKYLRDNAEIDVTIGVGDGYMQAGLIGKSYIEAYTAIDYSQIEGGGKVIVFSEMFSSSLFLDNYPAKELMKLEFSLLNRSAGEVLESINSITGKIKELGVPLFIAKCICYDIINTIIKVEYKMNSGFLKNTSLYPDVIELAEFYTIDNLIDMINRISSGIFNFIKKSSSESSDYLLNQIFDYIDENYPDYSFSVGSMSDSFGVTASNLSHYFKNKTGRTISEYVTDLRIEKTKQLLIETCQPVGDIITMVGYCDLSSFIKKFKGLVGMTPGEFRKCHESVNK